MIVLEAANSYRALSPDPAGQLISLLQPLRMPPLCPALPTRLLMVGAYFAMSIASMEENQPLILYIAHTVCLLLLTSLALAISKLRDSVE